MDAGPKPAYESSALSATDEGGFWQHTVFKQNNFNVAVCALAFAEALVPPVLGL